MSIFILAEHADGKLKKASLEAATFAAKLAQANGGMAVHALVLGALDAAEAQKLGKYGVGTIHHDADGKYAAFESKLYAHALAAAAQAAGAKHIVLAQSYTGRAVAPRVAVKLEASLLSGIHTLPEGGKVKRVVYSNKGIQTQSATRGTVVYTLKANAFQPEESAGAGNVVAFSYAGGAASGYKVLETKKFSDTISLTEAEVVVSAGRGMKGPENWGMIEELATLLGAATACSKPVADIHWRPHHEHVGQTGIQIAPNVYIAVGISGAIQHLAGVSASKTIIVINKDPEAPFFKAADYGIVGDAFDVLPKLLAAVKAYKAAN